MSGLERGSFAGHETFPFRYAWLPKAVEAVARESTVFGREDAMVEFGVGKNMVRSMRHWGLVCEVVEEDPTVPNNRGRCLRPTALGQRLLGPGGWDPYLEDPATVWLLHWQLASNPGGPTTWYWTFNHVPQPEFTKAQLLGWLLSLAQQYGWSRVADASLKRDIDCFVRTYVPARPTRMTPLEETLDCPLVELGLLREFGAKGTYLLARTEQETLPDEVFAYGLAAYLARAGLSARTMPLETIASAPGAPRRVFCLSEEALLVRLERLATVTRGALSFDETAGLRQVLIHKSVDPMTLLARYYSQAGSAGVAA